MHLYGMNLCLALLHLLVTDEVRSEPIRLPISSENTILQNFKRSEQVPLHNDQTAPFSPPDLPIWGRGLYTMSVPIQIGTPPQSFSVLLSLNARDLWILSSECHDWRWRSYRHYNSSLSSTYAPNDTTIEVPFWKAMGKGYTSQDVVTIGGVLAKDQTFAEAIDIQAGINLGEYYEGALGLGSRAGNSSTGVDNIVTSLFKQGLIPENIFSFIVPFNEGGEVGELILGGVPDDVEDIRMITVLDETLDYGDGFVHTGWHVAVSNVTIGDGTLSNSTLPPYSTAWLELELPFIGLPNAMYEEMNVLIDAKQVGWGPLFEVDCMKRDTFPDLVFELGGEEFRITPFEYTFEDGDSCISGLEGWLDDGVMLGGAFLRGMKSVFDMERNMVGFSELNHRS